MLWSRLTTAGVETLNFSDMKEAVSIYLQYIYQCNSDCITQSKVGDPSGEMQMKAFNFHVK